MIRAACKQKYLMPIVVLVLLLTGFVSHTMAEESQVITLEGFDREIWVPHTTVRGVLTLDEIDGEAYILVNDTKYLAEITNNKFQAEVSLKAGDNSIVGLYRDESGDEYVSNELIFDLRLEDRPKAEIDMQLGQEVILLTAENSRVSKISGSPLVEYAWEARPDNPEPLEFIGLVDGFVAAKFPQADGEYYLTLEVTDKDGNTDQAATYFVVEDGKPRMVEFATENPRWIEDAIVYGVMPNNIGLFGLQSVIDHLDYLADLGVNTLWLSPIQDSLTTGHGYDLIDYFEIRSNYGTKEDLRELITKAHAKGMRVLMDVVPNHTDIRHRFAQHTLEYGERSPYFDYYQRDANGNFRYYFNWDYLPNLNFDNPEVVNWMTEGMAYWVREFDVDGFRVDVAWGIRERNPEFWPQLRAELKRIKPDVFLLAEASARDDYYFTNGFDAAYDWTDQLGRWAWEHVFEEEGEIPTRLNAALTNNGQGYHPDSLVFRFMNNNDTDVRFITRYGPELTRTAAALLLTLPGIPQIYTGQEAGAEFRPYMDNWPVPLTDLHNLRGYYTDLVSLRTAEASLRSRQWEILTISPKEALYGYVRYSEESEPILVLLNFSSNQVTAKLDVEELTPFFGGVTFTDLLTEETVSFQVTDQTVSTSLDPWNVRILKAQ